SWDNLDRYRRNAWTDYNRAITQLSKMQKERKSEPAEQLKQEEREERAEIRHAEYLKKTVAPLVRWQYTPANEEKLGSLGQTNLFEDAPVQETPEAPSVSMEAQPILTPEAA
ncbi:MAG: hypothetical protein H7039_08440, partial [Bryobacteraceae bacterium]|nr:hypothetical protein [Bryobacteraceae bacterium]